MGSAGGCGGGTIGVIGIGAVGTELLGAVAIMGAELDGADMSGGGGLELSVVVELAGADKSGGGVLPWSVGASRLQPSMSMATRAQTLTASTQPTVIFKRERRTLCCSSSEPLGTNGFGLFILFGANASWFSRRFLFFEFCAAELSLEKFRNALNYF